MQDCIACGRDMTGADLTDRWEDGDNPHAYVICPHCRHKNELFGYGGDDD